jgi:hypothetical protein
MPYRRDKHGQIIKNCMNATKEIFEKIEHENSIREENKININLFVPFNKPDTTAFCFLILPDKHNSSLKILNEYTNHLYDFMSVKEEEEDINEYKYLLSRTDVSIKKYLNVLENIFDDDDYKIIKKSIKDNVLNANAKDHVENLNLLRIFIINPFISYLLKQQGSEFRIEEKISNYIFETADKFYPLFVFQQYNILNKKRLGVFIVEDRPEDYQSITFNICKHEFAKYLDFDIPFTKINTGSVDAIITHIINTFDPQKHKKAIIDLKLTDEPLIKNGIEVVSLLIKNNVIKPDDIIVYSRHLGPDNYLDRSTLVDVFKIPEENLISKENIENSIDNVLNRLCIGVNYF